MEGIFEAIKNYLAKVFETPLLGILGFAIVAFLIYVIIHAVSWIVKHFKEFWLYIVAIVILASYAIMMRIFGTIIGIPYFIVALGFYIYLILKIYKLSRGCKEEVERVTILTILLTILGTIFILFLELLLPMEYPLFYAGIVMWILVFALGFSYEAKA